MFLGQRLNIELYYNDEPLANAYYHWGGYSLTALELASMVVSNIDNVKESNNTLKAIRLLEKTGALLTREEITKAESLGFNEDFKEAVSRNEGLIAITKKGMKETRYWAESDVDIHIDSKTIYFSPYMEHTKDYFIEELSCDYEVSYDELPESPVMILEDGCIEFEELDYVRQQVLDISSGFHQFLKLPNGNVLEFY